MTKRYVDVYLADVRMWNGLHPLTGMPGFADKPPVPKERDEADLVVPFVNVPLPWSDTIDLILKELKRGQLIDKLFMMGHGQAGEFRVGQLLRWDDDVNIARFKRLRPFTAQWSTNVYILGCESAADGLCIPGSLNVGGQTISGLCQGQFSGSTGKPGYQLLRKLADTINAPVSGSVWKTAIKEGWTLEHTRYLTVGPGGAWVYRGIVKQSYTFGSP